jgi:sensor histidine kinase YesM
MKRILRMLAANAAFSAIPPVLYWVINPRPQANVAREVWAYSLVYASCIGLLMEVAFPWAGPRIWRHPSPRRWVLLLGFLLLAAAAGTIIGAVALTLMGVIPPRYFLQNLVSSFKIGGFITLAVGIGSAVIAELRGRLEETSLELRTKELERERALKLASEAKLQSIESRIHPHFLFNALNSVASLIREDPERAERQIERIARFLRFAIDQGGGGVVTVEQEMRIVGDYLAIEQTRFGERLRYEVRVDPDAALVEVPPMSVQTLAENSVKFAIAPRREGGMVRVSAVRERGLLAISVVDDGPGFNPELRPVGHGLDLLEKRLAAQFGSAARLQFRNGDGMTVRMELPCVRS